MRILWLSNKLLSPKDTGDTGNWLDTMARMLVDYGGVELGNIAFGPVNQITRSDYGPIRQWAIPDGMPLRNGLPHPRHVAALLKEADRFSPDMVHVWGTENFWGLLTARKLMPYPALLSIQGLKFAIAPFFSGGLTCKEQWSCIGLKELVKRCSIPQMRKKFEEWGEYEREIISGHSFIAALRSWGLSHVRLINKTGTTFRSDYILRQPFYQAPPFFCPSNHTFLCVAAYPAPFKGLHVAVRAVRHLKNRFPDIELRIAGNHQASGLHRNGYVAWLNREIGRMDLQSNIVWLGALSASRIITEMRSCCAVIVPSFVESYCLTMAEAMMAGMPVVSSYAGNLPDLARHNESALFFSPGDAAACAFQMERIMTERELAMRISEKAREIAIKRHDPHKNLVAQVEMYRQVSAEKVQTDESIVAEQ
ncbi:MAG: glycosyltransferase family 4 protein [Candidatus Latescibacterota bacterium]